MRLVFEDLGPTFKKWHFDGFPFHATIHHIKGPDEGDPHCHPWDFTRHILIGDYEEENYDKETGIITMNHVIAGTSSQVLATDVHRIVRVSEGGCWTVIVPGPICREHRFWRFGRGPIVSRAWHEPNYPE